MPCCTNVIVEVTSSWGATTEWDVNGACAESHRGEEQKSKGDLMEGKHGGSDLFSQSSLHPLQRPQQLSRLPPSSSPDAQVQGATGDSVKSCKRHRRIVLASCARHSHFLQLERDNSRIRMRAPHTSDGDLALPSAQNSLQSPDFCGKPIHL